MPTTVVQSQQTQASGVPGVVPTTQNQAQQTAYASSLQGSGNITDAAARRFGWTTQEGVTITQSPGFRAQYGSDAYYAQNRLGQGAIVRAGDLVNYNLGESVSTYSRSVSMPAGLSGMTAKEMSQMASLPSEHGRTVTTSSSRVDISNVANAVNRASAVPTGIGAVAAAVQRGSDVGGVTAVSNAVERASNVGSRSSFQSNFDFFGGYNSKSSAKAEPLIKSLGITTQSTSVRGLESGANDIGDWISGKTEAPRSTSVGISPFGFGETTSRRSSSGNIFGDLGQLVTQTGGRFASSFPYMAGGFFGNVGDIFEKKGAKFQTAPKSTDPTAIPDIFGIRPIKFTPTQEKQQAQSAAQKEFSSRLSSDPLFEGASFAGQVGLGFALGGIKSSSFDFLRSPGKVPSGAVDLSFLGRSTEGEATFGVPVVKSGKVLTPKLSEVKPFISEIKLTDIGNIKDLSGNLQQMSFGVSAKASFKYGGKTVTKPIVGQSDIFPIFKTGMRSSDFVSDSLIGKQFIPEANPQKVVASNTYLTLGNDIFGSFKGVSAEQGNFAGVIGGRVIKNGKPTDVIGSFLGYKTGQKITSTGERVYSVSSGLSIAKEGKNVFGGLGIEKLDTTFNKINRQARNVYSNSPIKFKTKQGQASAVIAPQLESLAIAAKPDILPEFASTKYIISPVSDIGIKSPTVESVFGKIVSPKESSFVKSVYALPVAASSFESSFNGFVSSPKQAQYPAQNQFGVFKQPTRSGYDVIGASATSTRQENILNNNVKEISNQLTGSGVSMLPKENVGTKNLQRLLPKQYIATKIKQDGRSVFGFDLPFMPPASDFGINKFGSAKDMNNALGFGRKKKLRLTSKYEPSLAGLDIGQRLGISVKNVPRSVSPVGVRPIVINVGGGYRQPAQYAQPKQPYNYQKDLRLPKVMRAKNAPDFLGQTAVYLGGKPHKAESYLSQVSKSPFGSAPRGKKVFNPFGMSRSVKPHSRKRPRGRRSYRRSNRRDFLNWL